MLSALRWWYSKQVLRLKLYLTENYYQEAESLIIWYAVCYALGTAFYFAFPFELSIGCIVFFLEAVLVLLYLKRNQMGQFKLLSYVAVFILGLSMAKGNAVYQARQIEKNVPEITYLRGKISDIDYGRGKRQRLLLTETDNLHHSYKGDFRISLNYPAPWLKVGKCVELVVKLPQNYSPNPLSNYNFERSYFYKNISATGYAISPIYSIDCPEKTHSLANIINSAREKVKQAVGKYASPESRGIIQALSIGDKSLISEQQTDNYRTAGLAHFLAISGMHMGMIAVLILFLVRLLLAPIGSGRYDLRKPAAVVSFLFITIYYLISGQSVSCTRAFIMTSVILLGILLNRRSISFRLWAFSVIVIASINPLGVISPGFLMSFGAVLGLVAFYEKNIMKINSWFKDSGIFNRLCTYLLGAVIVDFFATMMTLPYSVYFFKQISVYTSLGNLLASPIIAFLVMPSLFLFLISLPVGLSSVTLPILDFSVSLINKITEFVSGLPGAHSGEMLGQMSNISIMILTLSLLWLCIWQAKWRYWGIIGICIGILTMIPQSRPDFVFDDKGTTFAYREGKDLKISCWHQNKFLERMWTGTTQRKNKKCGETFQSADMKCQNQKCIYKNRIEFSLGQIKYDGKEVKLRNGGYIDLEKGVRYYYPEHGRLWNKN